MQTRSLATGVLLAVALVALPSAERPAASLQLLHPGIFHRIDVESVPARGWLALVRTGTRTELRPVTVAVAIVPDDIDPIDGPYTARKVWAMGLGEDIEPVFMARGVTELRASTHVREATIEGAAWDEQFGADLAEARRLRVTLGTDVYRLEVHPFDRRAALGDGASVRLASAAAEQEIYRSVARPDQPAWLALWAGDLDGDARLDLYMDLSASYNVSRRVLLLSSAAAPGDLVREVASFQSTGALDDMPTWTARIVADPPGPIH